MADERDETRNSDPFETPTVAPSQKNIPENVEQFPVPDWEKYRFVSYIGQGGMGRVYLAEDQRLKRQVALKFLRGDDPAMARRFLREAQSQAGIEHPNVCKVYEAGEVGGKLYIAMQYIDGKTLTHAREEMTREQKVRVIHGVAEGLHAAHRTGLIHRDIKPGNIMLERNAEGEWHPYILDFGLAREIDAEGMTVTGALVGTPRYMAPEQAWGELGLLDRRADIYSLGATLYELLSGHVPIEAESSMGILKRMLDEEPQKLARWSPDVPQDLQTIVMKCLEREPQRRYDTAHELAEDLKRFLNGDPVTARPASLTYRLTRKAQKHKALVVVISVAFVAVCALGALALRSQMQARQRAELSRRFGQQVERMESVLRIGREIPAHDMRREQEFVRRMMRDIETQMNQLGDAARGPGYYAIGRGYLSLDQPEKARENLDQAWSLGYHDPEVAYALGLTLGKLYRSELRNVESISNKDEREKRRREAQTEFRDPAIRYLKLSQNAEIAAPEYAEGLIALYENRYDDALKRAATAIDRLPWLYEARLLEGDVHLMIGNAKRNSGDYDEAAQQYAKAEAAYRASARIGESDVQVFESLLSLQMDRINLALYGKGEDLGPLVQESLKAAQEARTIDPARASIPASVSQIHRMLAEDQFNRGADPSAAIQDAIRAAEAALKLEPENARAFANLGTARELQAELEMYAGRDPRNTMNQAISELQKAAELDPRDSYVHNILGIAYNMIGQYERSHGMDPTASHEGAIASCNRALSLNPKNTNALTNLATGYTFLAIYQSDRGSSPLENYNLAESALRKVLEINPRSAYALNNLGSVIIRRGHYEREHGTDPMPTYESGLEILKKVNEIYPDDPFPYFNARDAFRGMALFELDSGRDPQAWLSRAEESFQKGLERNARLPGSYVDQARVQEVRIRHQIKQGRNPATAIASARSHLKKALELDPTKTSAILTRGVISLLEGNWDSAEADIRKAIQNAPDQPEAHLYLSELFLLRSQKDPSQNLIREGLAAADTALKLNSSLARAFLYRAQLLELQASSESDNATKSRLMKSAEEALEKAVSINPQLR